MKTTAGSLALAHAPSPARDAFVVQKLREAGALILGKTNLSEWANLRSSRSGIIPISHTQDTAGPMARTVRDAAILLTALAGTDPRDHATEEADRRRPLDYTRSLDAKGLRGARLGVVRNLLERHAHVDRIIQPALELLRTAGATLVEVELNSTAYDDAELEVLLFEFKADLNAYLSGRGGAVKDLSALIAFNEKHREQEMPFFGQELLLQAQAKGPLTDKRYVKALEACRQARRPPRFSVHAQV